MLEISNTIRTSAAECEAALADIFRKIDENALKRTEEVLEAFQAESVSEAMFFGTTGYGYDDLGRAALEHIFARIFRTESALVRVNLVNGTHAIACALYGACEPGKLLVSGIGTPYDTLAGIIGITGELHGSLKSIGVGYREVATNQNGLPDIPKILEAVSEPNVGAVLLQRSRGYSSRPSMTASQLNEIIEKIRKVNPNVNIVVDNCYGEFVCADEPKGDLICGSLIKNPGGGIAPAGGYIAGRTDLVDRAAYRMTVPGIGGEVGATLGVNRLLFQGIFNAPHTVAQALKTAVFAAAMAEKLGFTASPSWRESRGDIIQTIEFGKPEPLVAYCEGIQNGSPVDSFVRPEPWPMPGYNCDVIMAAGAFIQGASIELSCDAPMRPPYTAYMQGGLTYESGKLGVMMAMSKICKLSKSE